MLCHRISLHRAASARPVAFDEIVISRFKEYLLRIITPVVNMINQS